ncbi:acyl-CoA thioesterase [Halalkalibacter nanhaiisediminis]|uniref:Acyl-CoA thioester hydrolase n=1 Tax=Halalkalibacter nanhaiisediminis TaxID=688079 RepID=A0A562QLH0_9BACI|nr:thioesterase family protein [Halalkalibacter nanhaiisediminis]TWI57040.1 acyl-CoA thioester hydrolase [Halalkalibacter nanhaiisediminis]
MKVPAYITDIQEWQKSFQFSISIRVRFSETDAFGHLNNTNAFVYFEQARTDFYKSLGFMKKWTNEQDDSMVVVADMQCDYLQQIKFDEELKVQVKVHRLGRSSADLHYAAQNEKGILCLTGRGTIVQISKESGRSLAWNEEMREVLLTHTIET